jgi:hypothetical protein
MTKRAHLEAVNPGPCALTAAYGPSGLRLAPRVLGAAYCCSVTSRCAAASRDRNLRTAADGEELDGKRRLPATRFLPSRQARKEPSQGSACGSNGYRRRKRMTRCQFAAVVSWPKCVFSDPISASPCQLCLGSTFGGSNEKLFVVWDRHCERPYASARTRLSAARSRGGPGAHGS